MAFEELKARQSVMWGKGAYQRVTETIADIHDLVLARIQPRGGEEWLDVATGTGAVAERAAAAGARVTGLDLAPALIDTARDRARERVLEIEYVVGDCEGMPFGDASFDVVSSVCGVMFSPDHEATARELARVTRPGGRIALANWTPTGGVGRMFAVIAPFQPSPPPSSPFDWGREDRARELLGDAFELEIEERSTTLRVADGEEYWQLFSTSFGPVKTLAETLEPDRRDEFRRAYVAFFDENYRTDDGVEHVREYLLILGTRR